MDPVEQEATAFAPATVANLGPGFDWLGCAVEGQGDTVVATVLPDRPGEVVVESITGDNGRLSLAAEDNCAGIGAAEVLKRLPGPPSCGVSLKLMKGLPLGSGMGSSAASAAAGAAAVNALFGSPLAREELVLAGLVSEATVSGYHADNIAPAVLGGFVLVRNVDPIDLQCLPYGGDELWFTLVNPVFEAPTKEMRAVLPAEVPFKSMINNSLHGGSLVASILTGDAVNLGKSLNSDIIIEPTRGPLIPGFQAVKEAANGAGAYGCTISGAGPTICAVVPNPEIGHKVGEAMAEAFRKEGKLDINTIQVVKLCMAGTKLI
eukprot:CAMPEP_0117665380 /NCGR_PEP_ID=MMETSP0804-20121206/9778_1 /TAXON_ID=1074897 /ORGANISM="Tetraselmis astigmatica, Strain CCMP880" /LENGTH=319 /DNA_ID=CAMNT_0005472787 /DNA_START=281 /DNA_END=1240 /DNA_ORIENTATION=-